MPVLHFTELFWGPIHLFILATFFLCQSQAKKWISKAICGGILCSVVCGDGSFLLILVKLLTIKV
jgi:hypothetical protein